MIWGKAVCSRDLSPVQAGLVETIKQYEAAYRDSALPEGGRWYFLSRAGNRPESLEHMITWIAGPESSAPFQSWLVEDCPGYEFLVMRLHPEGGRSEEVAIV